MCSTGKQLDVTINCRHVRNHRLKTLEGNDADLVQYVWIVGSDRQRLVEEPLGKLRVVRESVLEADV